MQLSSARKAWHDALYVPRDSQGVVSIFKNFKQKSPAQRPGFLLMFAKGKIVTMEKIYRQPCILSIRYNDAILSYFSHHRNCPRHRCQCVFVEVVTGSKAGLDEPLPLSGPSHTTQLKAQHAQ